MFVRLCLLGILSTVAVAGPAMSKDSRTAGWGQVGGWEVRVDPTFGNGCFATRHYEDGTAIRVGIDVHRNSLYILLANRVWKSLEDGKTYPVRFVFDQLSTYDGDMAAVAWGDMVVLGRSGVSVEFMTEFLERSGVRVYHGDAIAELSLLNARDALREVAMCQKEVSAANQQESVTAGRPVPSLRRHGINAGSGEGP
jgi:hypothetical protein